MPLNTHHQKLQHVYRRTSLSRFRAGSSPCHALRLRPRTQSQAKKAVQLCLRNNTQYQSLQQRLRLRLGRLQPVFRPLASNEKTHPYQHFHYLIFSQHACTFSNWLCSISPLPQISLVSSPNRPRQISSAHALQSLPRHARNPQRLLPSDNTSSQSLTSQHLRPSDSSVLQWR